MTVQLGLIKSDPSAVPAQTTCEICPSIELNIFQAVSGATPIPVHQSDHFTLARRIICRDEDLHDVVPVICDGWAASIATLSDSSRQILSFLLPGDTYRRPCCSSREGDIWWRRSPMFAIAFSGGVS